MLVQAKRLDDSDRFYSGIDYKVAKKPTDGTPHVRQIDRLIQTARQRRQLPIYIFYNHIDNPNCIPLNCITLQGLGKVSPQSWGISFASAFAVRIVLPDKRFARHQQHSRPFHCLLCSQGVGDGPGSRPKGSPGVVAAALSRLFTGEGYDELVRLDMSSLLEPIEGVPHMFMRAEEVASLGDPEERDQEAEMLGREFRDIAGAVILRDSEDVVAI